MASTGQDDAGYVAVSFTSPELGGSAIMSSTSNTFAEKEVGCAILGTYCAFA